MGLREGMGGSQRVLPLNACEGNPGGGPRMLPGPR